MIDWMLRAVLNMAVVVMFFLLIAVFGLGVMVAFTVIYHVYVPECPTIVCFS